ncbi:hypothetical protein P280DRAFT_470402 [Massarina eburnea CBS 473.64]|uniref:SMODS and SLOG-associating 2TM effector domain-containing protein n=1 Tax=Massarina eburnea CBS 473.64 TaxID=1395130 RepID=A0A6A6RYE9_9PLEO|nr:hypothetical protein P280DRAFT_470402 [Massarina eburnea CBS 473.64]
MSSTPNRARSPTSITTTYLDSKITIESFRNLVGLPDVSDTPTRLPRWWPNSLRRGYRRRPGPESGIYPNILHEERLATRKHRLYTVTQYGGLVIQFILSAALILLASVPANFNVVIAALGAVNGVVTGLLALIGGQGLPHRLVQYRDGLRGLREQVEWLEREIEVGVREVRYREVVRLRDAYEGLRGDEVVNRPDFWVSFGGERRNDWIA